jgi:hypothetical protein
MRKIIARLARIYTGFRILFQGAVATHKTFHLQTRNGKGSLQAAHRPRRYFAVKMDSGRSGIMRCLKVESYQDFSRPCYSVDFLFTGWYVDELF